MSESPSSLYSLDKLRRLYLNNEAFVVKTVEVYIVQIIKDLKMMNLRVACSDWEELRKVAHKMKPNIDLLEMTTIAQDIRYIEKNASSETVKETEEKVQKVSQTIESVRDELKEYLKENLDLL